jgi:hypothetical protein
MQTVETRTTKQGIVIGNVGTLDLRNATEESVAGIGRIGNVGMLMYSRETARFVTHLNAGNVGSSLEVPPNARVLSGVVSFTPSFFKGQPEPQVLLVAGQLVVEPDVAAEDIVAGLSWLVVAGQLICPEHLMGALQSKLSSVQGQTITYPRNSRLVMGKLILDEGQMRSLEDGSILTVVGNLSVPAVLPNDLLAQKIGQVQVTGHIRCPEENAQTLQARLATKGVRMRIVPRGFTPVDEPVSLDRYVLQSLPGKKLYCTERVVVAQDVEGELLQNAIDAIVAEGLVICPARLGGVIARKVDMLKTNVVLYEGELWLVEGEAELRATRFDYLDGKLTLVVTGELKIDPAADPKLLAARLAKVHNLGEISGTPEQLAAIQARLGIGEGELIDAGQGEAEEEGLGNVGYLAL